MAGYFGDLKDSDYFGEFFSSSSSPSSSIGYFGDLKSSDYFGEFWSNAGSGGSPIYISVTEGASPSDSVSILSVPAGVVWPYQLPTYVERSGFVYTLSSSSLSTAMSTGYAKRRKRYTGQYATYQISMIMTIEEVTIFEQFFNNNLGYGVVSFYFPDPLFIEDYILARFKAGEGDPPYVVDTYGSTSEYAVVSFELERLISGYSTVAVTSWPSTLPDCSIHEYYSTEVQSGVLRDTDYTKGHIDVRRRFTATIRKHNMTMLFTREQLEVFFDFYASLGYGSLSFTAPYPLDTAQTMKARFDTSQGFGYTVEYYNETDLFLVSFIWEELPLLKDFT